MASNDQTFWQKYFSRKYWHQNYWVGQFITQVVDAMKENDFTSKGHAHKLDGESGTSIKTIPGGGAADAFGRMRVSSPHTSFQAMLEYGLNSAFYDQDLTGSATAVHDANLSAVKLKCTTASGDKCIRQSSTYVAYQPGKSQLIMASGVMGAAKSGVRQRIGFFDDNNGLFFEQTSSGISVVRRTSTSGSPVDEAKPQAKWNMDTFNGSKTYRNANQLDVDLSKVQIFFIDFEWLGAGTARLGFVIDGEIHYCHEFAAANVLTTPYMTTPNLPIRYEIENISTAASATEMLQICGTVISEGGFERHGLVHAAGTSTAGVTVGGTEVPLFSIRPALLFGGKSNHSIAYPLILSALNNNVADLQYRIRINGILTGTPSWSSVESDSMMEIDIAATGITGGHVRHTGYLSGSGQGSSDRVSTEQNDIPLSVHMGDVQDILTVTGISLGGNINVNASMSWREFL